MVNDRIFRWINFSLSKSKTESINYRGFTNAFARSARYIALRSAAGVSRVFSVFAPDPIAQMLADLWGNLTGVDFVREPYYHATFSICTRDTHIDQSMTIHPSLRYDIRPAVESDIANMADLCFGSALGSVSRLVPFSTKKYVLIQHSAIGTFCFDKRWCSQRGQIASNKFLASTH
jgi:hypothetical protein